MSVLEPIRSRGSGAAGIVHGNEWSWFNHARYDTSGGLVAEYSTEPASAAGTEYLIDDHLGSTRLVTTAGGGVLKRYDFLPFGEELWRALQLLRRRGQSEDEAHRQTTG